MASKQATAQVHTAGPYRNNPAWLAAAKGATGAQAGNPAYKAAAQVITHLGWRAPGGTVGWHTNTVEDMVKHAATLGVHPGMGAAAAMALAVAALAAAANTPQQQQHAAALLAMLPPAK